MDGGLARFLRGKSIYFAMVAIGATALTVWWGLAFPAVGTKALQWSDIVFESCVLALFLIGLAGWLLGMSDVSPRSVPLGFVILAIGGTANLLDEFWALPEWLQDVDQKIQLVGFGVLAAGLYRDRREKLALLERNRQMAELAAASESRYRALLDNTLVGVYLVEDGKFRYVNQEFCRIFGYTKDEIEGKLGPLDLTAPDYLAVVQEELQKRLTGEKAFSRYGFKALRKDGTLIDVEVHGARLEQGGRVWIHGVILDVTEARRAEQERRFVMAQLAQAQKMEAIGMLASGIAHDFNNLLSAVLGSVTLLRTRQDLPPDVQGDLGTIETAGRKAAELTRQLFALAKGGQGPHQPLALGDCVRQIAELVRRTFPKAIRLEVQIDPDAPLIEGNQTQIEQCLLNLCINARDAMPDGGVLTIRVSSLPQDRLGRASLILPQRERYVEILVEDTGVGMDEKVRERVFEPFFTEKGQRGGTGLGLAIVYNIVRNHGGWIDVESSPGKGTSFRLLFPALQQEEPSVR
jgi:PAS domain S-box-containing protein